MRCSRRTWSFRGSLGTEVRGRAEFIAYAQAVRAAFPRLPQPSSRARGRRKPRHSLTPDPLLREGSRSRPSRQRCHLALLAGSCARRSPERVTRDARRARRVQLMYPRCTRVLRDQATRNADLQGFWRSPLTDSNRRPPPYHADPEATGRNPRQRFLACFGRFRGALICHGLPPVATARLHKRSILCGPRAVCISSVCCRATDR